MAWLAFSVTVLGAYLLGSFPTGYLVGRVRGIDIRRVGSGNIGAANTFRVFGRSSGLFVLGVDAFKGFAACQWVAPLAYQQWVAPDSADPARRQQLLVAAGLAAVVGHIYTCWLGFKGGKGIATAAGVFGALAWEAVLLSLGLWIVVLLLSRYVSLASMFAAAGLPFMVWLTRGSPWLLGLTLLVSTLALLRHKDNWRRLCAGTEPRLGQAPTRSPTP